MWYYFTLISDLATFTALYIIIQLYIYATKSSGLSRVYHRHRVNQDLQTDIQCTEIPYNEVYNNYAHQ